MIPLFTSRSSTPTGSSMMDSFVLSSLCCGNKYYSLNSLEVQRFSIQFLSMRSFIIPLQLALLLVCVSAFSQRKGSSQKLPKYDAATDNYFPPAGVSPSQFYSPVFTLIRAGPVPFLTRLTSPQKYEQSIWKYQYEAKEPSLLTAQGNMDAFFAAPDVWAEQKLLEQQGRREVFDYGKEAPAGRVALSIAWGSFVSGLLGRVLWQLLHGERNLF